MTADIESHDIGNRLDRAPVVGDRKPGPPNDLVVRPRQSSTHNPRQDSRWNVVGIDGAQRFVVRVIGWRYFDDSEELAGAPPPVRSELWIASALDGDLLEVLRHFVRDLPRDKEPQ